MHVIKTGETYQRMSSDDMSRETLDPNVKSVKTRKTYFIKCQEHYQEVTKNAGWQKK